MNTFLWIVISLQGLTILGNALKLSTAIYPRVSTAKPWEDVVNLLAAIVIAVWALMLVLR